MLGGGKRDFLRSLAEKVSYLSGTTEGKLNSGGLAIMQALGYSLGWPEFTMWTRKSIHVPLILDGERF